ncbi:MAG TPA: DUF503 domain-containing protein [Urbifossiella sp.]|jgi:hypothetical protein|nr:DUF503 domain-containing protein [Urbifossiella sp.]
MTIGSLTARLLIRESRSLKDKRQVVRSILDRVKGGFNVSAAEIESHDDVKVAVLGFAVVAAESEAARGVLNQIAEALRKHPIAECLGCEITTGHEVV